MFFNTKSKNGIDISNFDSSVSYIIEPVWRCNHKYWNDEKCETPHLTEDELKGIFLKATNQLVNMKEEVISNYEEMKEMLFGAVDLEDELNEVAGLIEDCINENARVALDQ